MPFYCGKRSADICVVLGPKKSSTYSLGKERVLARSRWAGVIGYASGFFEHEASNLPASPFPRNEALLGQAPRDNDVDRRDGTEAG
jgi:hypothetical protein